MNVIKTFLFFIALFSIMTHSHAGENRDMLQNFLDRVDSMQAEFQQKLLDPNGILMQESAGDFVLKRPGKFMWDYELPYPQKIVSNGDIIWIYDSELEQVSIKPYSQILTGAPVILLDQRKDLDEEFNIEEKGSVDNLHWVVLTPRSADNEFKEIRVGMKDKQLRTIMLVDAFDQTTIIEFHNLRLNPKLDDAQFEFEPPAGTDVVGEH